MLGVDSGGQSTSSSSTTELQPCPVPAKKVVATVLPVGDERVQQPKKKTYCVYVSNHVYMSLCILSNFKGFII